MSLVDQCLPLSSPHVHVATRCRCVVGRSVFPAVITTRSRCDTLSLCRRSIIVSRCRHHSFTLRPAAVVSSVDHRSIIVHRCRHHSFTLLPAVVVSSVDQCLPLSSPLVHVEPRCRCVVGRSLCPAVVTTRSRCAPLSLCRRSIIVSRCRHSSFTLLPAVVVSSVDHCFPLSSQPVHVAPRCRCVVGRSSFIAVITTRSRCAPRSLCRRSIIVFRCRLSSFT